jgi:glycosyltransferase involved in cell wall biosynthesis
MRLIYCDTALADLNGHYFSECKMTVNAFSAASVTSHIFGHVAAKEADLAPLTVHAHFRTQKWEWLGFSNDFFCGPIESLLISANIIAEDLGRIEGLEAADIVCWNHITPSDLFALGLWGASISKEKTPHFLLHLGLQPGIYPLVENGELTGKYEIIDRTSAEQFRLAAKRLPTHIKERIKFVAYDELAAKSYQELLLQEVHLVPFCSYENANPKRRNSSKITVSYLGVPRDPKGFATAPHVIQQLLQQTPDHVNFMVQLGGDWKIGGDKVKPEQQMIRDLASLNPRVKAVQGPLTELEYQGMLENTDLLLLPYDQQPYASQTSGPCMEALANGIVQVATNKTTMDFALRRHGMPGVLIDAPTVEQTVAGALEAIKNYDHLAEKAFAASQQWRSFHNRQNFMSHMQKFFTN